MSFVVERIVLREIGLRLREPFRISSGVTEARRILLLELVEAGGARVWSECVAGEAPNYSPETIETAWGMIRDFAAPRVLGKTFAHPEEVHAALEADFRGHRMAKAAVEMGAWALWSVTEGKPLAEVIGGERKQIATGISLGIQPDPETLVAKVAASLVEGYKKIKIKVKPGQDVGYLERVRAAVGDDAPLMADANSAYTLEDVEMLRRLDPLRLIMIEQPLAWDDLLRHAALQRKIETPVCLDESITSVDRAEDMIRLGAGRIVNIKPGRVGGYAASRAIHDLCAAEGMPVWCGGMLESGIGRAYNVALASLPNFSIPGDVSPSRRYWAEDIVSPEWDMDGEGYVAVPWDTPGIGVEVDEERVRALTVREEDLGFRVSGSGSQGGRNF